MCGSGVGCCFSHSQPITEPGNTIREPGGQGLALGGQVGDDGGHSLRSVNPGKGQTRGVSTCFGTVAFPGYCLDSCQ